MRIDSKVVMKGRRKICSFILKNLTSLARTPNPKCDLLPFGSVYGGVVA